MPRPASRTSRKAVGDRTQWPDLAVADLNLLIKFRDATPAPKAVFVVFDKPPSAVIARKSRGLAVPKDLEGKILGAPAGDDRPRRDGRSSPS